MHLLRATSATNTAVDGVHLKVAGEPAGGAAKFKDEGIAVPLERCALLSRCAPLIRDDHVAFDAAAAVGEAYRRRLLP